MHSKRSSLRDFNKAVILKRLLKHVSKYYFNDFMVEGDEIHYKLSVDAKTYF